MRVKLTLHLTGEVNAIPLNYQYPVSSFLYNTIEKSDSTFSKFLHEQGYRKGHKRFKLFTFGNIWARPFKIHKANQSFEITNRKAQLQLSFYGNDALKAFLMGSFTQQHFSIGDPAHPACDFIIDTAQILPVPHFKTTMRYKAITPICLSKKIDGQKHAHYLSPVEQDYSDIFLNNLTIKTMTASQHFGMTINYQEVDSLDFRITSTNQKRKPVTIKSHTPEETKIIGFTYTFELTAPIAMHRVLYYAGVGEKCSQGFGFVEVIGL